MDLRVLRVFVVQSRPIIVGAPRVRRSKPAKSVSNIPSSSFVRTRGSMRARAWPVRIDSAADLLHNSRFVDARVDLFAKYGSAQWTKLGAYPITRQLIAR